MSLYSVAVPAPSGSPRGPAGQAPGADVTLDWQWGEGLGLLHSQSTELPLLIPPYSCRAIFLASSRRVEGVKPITFGPFHCSSAGHLQISTIRLVMDLKTM